MSKINGIYAASMSILNDDLTLNAKRTISHGEKLIDQGCHGIAVFGSTGQAQLIPISEKIDLLNHLTKSKYKEKFIIGTGLNSLGETINLMNVSNSLNFKKFLIMPPAFYKFGDKDVINYYTKIIDANPESEIILYNFEKLCGYKFTVECVQELVKQFPKQQFIIDHIAKPEIRNQKISDWKIGIQLLAQNPNVACKISGLVTEADFTNFSPSDFTPYLDIVFEVISLFVAFTPSKIISCPFSNEIIEYALMSGFIYISVSSIFSFIFSRVAKFEICDNTFATPFKFSLVFKPSCTSTPITMSAPFFLKTSTG